MLIEFTVGNYRSFKEPQTLSMLASSLKSKDKDVDYNNIVQVEDKMKLLTSAAIYGANASGKSNLVAALEFMRRFVLNSPRRTERMGGIKVEPFRLSTTTVNKPSFFEIAFISDGIRYRYGFEVTQERVEREWLSSFPKGRQINLFEREADGIELRPSFKEGKEMIELTRPNALFLSVVAQFNGKTASKLLQWFRSLTIIFGVTDRLMRSTTMRFMEQGRHADEIRELIQRFDLGINDVRLEEDLIQLSLFSDEADISQEVNERIRLARDKAIRRGDMSIRTLHTLYDDDEQPYGEESFSLDEHESEGTRRLFALAGPLLDTLRRGRVMVVDELDARLHPQMTRELVQLFNNRELNLHGAQLIFNTQDSNLLDNNLFRRDQVWFVEKSRLGETSLYSLAEFRGEQLVRNDKDFAKGYLQGLFGAVPYLNLNKLQALVTEYDGEGE